MKEENGPLIALVVFIVFTVIFGVMAYMRYQDLTGVASPDKVITKLEREIDDLDGKRKFYEQKAEALRQRIREQQNLYDLNSSMFQAYAAEYQRRQKTVEIGDKFAQQATELSGQLSTDKQKTLQNLIKATTEAQDEMDREVKDLTDKKEASISRLRQLNEQFKDDVNKNRLTKNYEQSSLDDSNSILRDLTQREIERANVLNEADGKVLVADPVHNFCVINLGTDAGVKNGFRFECYAMHAGQQKLHKCYIEVTRVGVSRSECIIVKRPVAMPKDPTSEYVASEPEETFSPMQESGHKGFSAQPLSGRPKTMLLGFNEKEPLVEGDYVQNPFFSPGKPLNFYIAGVKEIVNERQKSAIRYRWTEIKAMAEFYGATVSDKADVNVNYVIAQKNPMDDPEFRKAVDLGLPVIYEWELFRFLDTK